MDEGAGKAMFILVTIIIFGIFVVIAYWLFEDQIRVMLDKMMGSAGKIVGDNLSSINKTPTGGGTWTPP